MLSLSLTRCLARTCDLIVQNDRRFQMQELSRARTSSKELHVLEVNTEKK